MIEWAKVYRKNDLRRKVWYFFMFNIAIMGFGVVGSGVWEVIKENSKDISKKLGGEGESIIDVKYILDLRTFEDTNLQTELRQILTP